MSAIILDGQSVPCMPAEALILKVKIQFISFPETNKSHASKSEFPFTIIFGLEQ